jgi:hypothetical protein
MDFEAWVVASLVMCPVQVASGKVVCFVGCSACSCRIWDDICTLLLDVIGIREDDQNSILWSFSSVMRDCERMEGGGI